MRLFYPRRSQGEELLLVFPCLLLNLANITTSVARAARNAFKGSEIDGTAAKYENTFKDLKNQFVEGQICDVKLLTLCIYDTLGDLSEYTIL